MTDTSGTKPARPGANQTLMMALVTSLATFSMHVFVPALPDVVHAIGSDGPTVQRTVTIYLAGLAFGQFLYGPVSDRIGRKPALIAGLTLYSIGCMTALVAKSITVLLIARLLQALGASAGLVLGRAIVRETASSDAEARGLAVLTLAMTLSTAVAPLAGGYLNSLVGWRGIFTILLGFSLILLVWVMTSLRTLLLEHSRETSSISHVMQDLLRNRPFTGYCVLGATSTVSAYAFYSTLPFFFSLETGEAGTWLPLVYLLIVTGSISGSVTAHRMSRIITQAKAARLSAWISLMASLGFLTGRFFLPESISTIVIPMWFVTFSGGFCSPNTASLAMNVDRQNIGSASSIYGFIQMLLGMAITFSVSVLGQTSFITGVVICVTAFGGLLIFLKFSYVNTEKSE